MNPALLKLIHGEVSLYPKQLEHHYPRIVENIINLWHTPQMEEFFQELMVNSRSDRQGFPHEVVDELYHLSEVFDGTCHLPTVHDEYPLAQLNSHQARQSNFQHSHEDFINIEGSSDDGPWNNIDNHSRTEIESLGYPCTASGFLKAAGAKDIKALSLFLRCNINIDTCDERGWTPLTIAAFNGNQDLVNLVIKLGANVNIKDNGGFSPLHWAAFNGHTDVIKLLVVKNTDVHAHSLRGWTPLMMAARNGHEEACAVLLVSGADFNAVSNHGWTALQMASFHNHEQVIKLFLSIMKNQNHIFKPVSRDEE
jgi:hypothetical protein